MERKKFYYKELTDDVFDDGMKEKIIDEKYKYFSKNIFYRILEFVYYHIIIFPVAWFYCKVIKRIKFVGRKKLKQIKKGGFFVYANHTHQQSDAFSPSQINAPNKIFIIVNPKNLNVPIFKSSTKLLGALPLPTGLKATRNFVNAIEYRLSKNKAILVYPEAKIWPYFTDIRPFSSVSFKYPVTYKKPIFTFTTTYQKKKNGKCKMVIYVDGPFYSDENLSEKEKQEQLAKIAYSQMKERAKLSNFQKYDYIKKENE